MDKGVVLQGTKDEKNKKVEATGRELSTNSKRFQLFGKNDKSGRQQKR